jgi:molecular chaperone DnaJ
MTAMPKDYYKILGVDKGASEEDIKAAFRKKAHEVHPDKTGGDDSKFKEVNEAYQALGNKEKRANYDRFGTAEPQGGFGGGGFGGFGQGGVQFDMNDLGDVFGDLFGGGGRGRQREQRGRHIEMDVRIKFEEAAFGTDHDVELYKQMACAECKGSGAEKSSKTINCMQCGGSGQEVAYQRTMLGTFQTQRICSRCHGRGKVPEKECRGCKGTGLTKGKKHLTIKIPAGINDGEVLRLSGEGEPVAYGAGAPGDLYLTIRVAPDKRFTRNNFDIHSVAEIDIPTAALGGTVTIPTLDGDTTLKVAPGTQPGQVLRLKEKGVPFLKRAGRGDMYVTLGVVIPKKLSKQQKKALEDWNA